MRALEEPKHQMRRCFLMLVASVVTAAQADQPLNPEDYNQWKKALKGSATGAEHITVPAGFEVQLLRSARAEEGSWVSMTFDAKGRVIIAREDRGLLRFTPGREARVDTFATNLHECRGLLFAFDALYANANNSKALYCLRDTDRDDHFDEIRLLKSTPGGVGHGRNDLVLGPDNFIYIAHGDDVGLPHGWTAPSFRGLAPDRLLPCEWEAHLYGEGVRAPGGHVIRTDRDGRTWEVIAGGLRNAYGLDFNADGELFTYDADLEWDIGLPWYHPTRVLHIVPGADYGWRRTTGSLPPFVPDTRPAVVDIGKGSPTAIRFGRRSNFPPEYRDALFILDWAYGRILAVHLSPCGASYRGEMKLFVQGRPLNVTDLEFGPDGALYFVTGGRKTQSALYRVRYTGPPLTRARESENNQAAELRKLRHRLENLGNTPQALDQAWAHLNHSDSWMRHAARVAVERQPVNLWQERALRETNAGMAVHALLALARAGDVSSRVLGPLDRVPMTRLSAEEKIALLRAYTVCFIRSGKPEPNLTRDIARRLATHYPDGDNRVNQQLCELLVYLDEPEVIRKTLPLLAAATAPEEKLHYLFALRLVRAGWTLPQRQTYFEALRDAQSFPGAHYLPLVLRYIKRDAEQSLSETERASLKDILRTEASAKAPAAPDTNRKFIRAWTVADLEKTLSSVNSGRNRQQGKRLFQSACAKCHVYAGEGSALGPELTGVAGRFSRRDLLDSILDPSKVVAEIYRNITVTTKDGVIHEGRFIAEDERSLTLATNPADPDQRWRVRKNDIALKQISELSTMPTGLLDFFDREEILDLLAFLEYGEK